MLGMKSASLLDVDSDKACDYHYHHGYESCQFTQKDGKEDEADERCSNRSCSEGEEPPTYSHEFKWLLDALENRIAIVIDFHNEE